MIRSPRDAFEADGRFGRRGSLAASGRSSTAADALLQAALRPGRPTHRPDVRPVDPETPCACLCGDPAEFVVETHWFSGRLSRDPVCERHVTEVVEAIRKKQAGRDGG
ncbi:hypothetical protein NE236_10605 [Actinoallomurus purpureus]|uniref:hypothetical protein n=1 Tax=Actinoallomurus purpureus TaxID=478114 RepID=UPI00209274B3|nr:hypothetical protein [Actinoallomurus purpureus]MCO6005432.1 hypothetical protein [Actinoallomurus purpureus]